MKKNAKNFGIPSGLVAHLTRYSEAIDDLNPKHVQPAIVITAAAGLFAELVIIRLQGAYIPTFAMLKNISLLSCFLGLGAGYAVARWRPLTFPIFPFLFLLQLVLLKYLDSSGLSMNVGNPIATEEMIGIQTLEGLEILYVVPLICLFFFLNALMFLPFGQLTGALMHRLHNIRAYHYNLLGSIGGILLFSLLAYFWLGGGIWIAFIALLCLPLLAQTVPVFLNSLVLFSLLLVVEAYSTDVTSRSIYSPYQTIDVSVLRSGRVLFLTNSLYYQRVLDLREEKIVENPSLKSSQEYYELPYRIVPDPSKVLIVGSGTGNDVAAASRVGAEEIVAVEIDPLIARGGVQLHPEHPYQRKNVRLVVTDARIFLKRNLEKYDVIAYGLLDSHTLLSGALGSGIRLDSYVYTVEAFREAKERLADGGVLTVAFVDMSPEFGRKLFLMLQEAFDGQPPRVIRTRYDASVTYVQGLAQDSLQAKVPESFVDVTEEFASNTAQVDKSVDDWPFLYMTRRTFPLSYLVLWIPLLLGTAIFLTPLRKSAAGRFHWVAFFLGAAFMLLETKAFTEMALVLGATFTVTCVVILCVLIAALLGNWFIWKGLIPSYPVAFGLLLLSIGFSYAAPGILEGWIPTSVEVAVRGGILTLPIFFAGICFSTELECESRLGEVFYANLLGAMFGGLIEYLSTWLGFSFLYAAAGVLYGLAFICALKKQPD